MDLAYFGSRLDHIEVCRQLWQSLENIGVLDVGLKGTDLGKNPYLLGRLLAQSMEPAHCF